MFFDNRAMIAAENALPGREQAMIFNPNHAVLGTQMTAPYPQRTKQLLLAMGCFWGAERLYWQLPGVYTTAVGYAGGFTPNPCYEEVCSGRTGHSETVLVIYEQDKNSIDQLLTPFWQQHDPTQGMRQGNDRGTQYRSAIYCDEDQLEQVEKTKAYYQRLLEQHNKGQITTEIKLNQRFYFAEDVHQQYLHKHPNGYCGLKGTGVLL